VVLTGAPPAFCAGLDLRALGVASLSELPPFIASVARSPVPVIAAVNGAAVTGGLELALAADLIVASTDATFADTHLRVGVFPGPVLVDLPRRVGRAWAREMSLTGNFVDAPTACRIGLANHVVPPHDVVPFALGLAQSIAEQDPDMVAAVRRGWEATDGLPLADARRVHLDDARAFGAGATTADAIASRRGDVLARSRRERSAGPEPEASDVERGGTDRTAGDGHPGDT
jgi:enoyl-CoA hydratase